MKKLILGVLLAAFFWSCSDKIEQVERAAYYWQGSNYYADENQNPIKVHEIKTLYVKYFEVDYNDAMGNFPFAKTSLRASNLPLTEDFKIIPTIFIKNNIFQYSSEKELDKLADNIVFLINKYNNEKFSEIKEFDEIQIDCDWTKSTQKKYFYLLSKIKELSKKDISCTLRVYAFCYPENMGVPPVDKAMLMCYNLIKPLEQNDKNSILEVEELKKYLNKKREYPVHLDVALPIFYWTHWYQNNQFVGLADYTLKELSFTKPVKPLWHEITKDTTINYDTYFRKGDFVKCEQVDAKTINETISLLKKYIVFDDKITVSLFDVQDKNFNQYTNEEITAFYTNFIQ